MHAGASKSGGLKRGRRVCNLKAWAGVGMFCPRVRTELLRSSWVGQAGPAWVAGMRGSCAAVQHATRCMTAGWHKVCRAAKLLSVLANSAHTYADYVGCMKTGPVIKSNQYRWYEPQHALIGAEYFAHAWGEHRGRCCCRPTAHVPASGLVWLDGFVRCIMQHVAPSCACRACMGRPCHLA